MTGADRTESYKETQRASLPRLGQGIEHLASMAEVLKKMSQDLLRQSEEIDLRAAKAGVALDDTVDAKGGGETRSLYLSSSVLTDECELFAECGVSSLSDLLGFICDSMFGTVLLMRNLDHEAELPGFAIQLIGESLEKYLDLLQRAQSYCSDIKIVERSAS